MDDCTHYPSGVIYCVVVRDLKTYFYEDGTPKTVEPYREGKWHGEVLLYWPNGILKRKCAFCEGLRHGLDQIWNEEGKLMDEDRYEMGQHV